MYVLCSHILFLFVNFKFCSVKDDIYFLWYILLYVVGLSYCMYFEDIIWFFYVFNVVMLLSIFIPFHLLFMSLQILFCVFYSLVVLKAGLVLMFFLRRYLFLFHIMYSMVWYCCSWPRSWQLGPVNFYQNNCYVIFKITTYWKYIHYSISLRYL